MGGLLALPANGSRWSLGCRTSRPATICGSA